MRYDTVLSPLDKIFDTFFNDSSARDVSTNAVPYFANTFSPPAWAQFRVKRNQDTFTIEGELAGVKKEDLKIEVVGDTLTIKGHRGVKLEENSKEVSPDELTEYAEFSNSFKLGNELDTENINARFENGFLNLRISRAENRKAKVIEVK